MGEFFAFLMGWNLILEYMIGVASLSNALSKYINSLIDYQIEQDLTNAIPISIDGFGHYFDLLAFAIAIFVTGLTFIIFLNSKTSRFSNLNFF